MAHFRPLTRTATTWLAAGALALVGAGKPAQARDLFSSLSPLGSGVDDGRVRLAGKAEGAPEHHHAEQKIPGDLTTLSLEQLMELEVVPINVLGGHTHPAGQWMVGYRYMFTHQGDNLVGTNEVSTRRLLRRYLLAPDSMDMEMHMLEGMYAPTDRLTLMLMVPYSRMWMEKQSLFSSGGGHGHGAATPDPIALGAAGPNAPRKVESRSAGWGDLTLMSLYTFSGSSDSGRRLLFNGGLSVPTGSIHQGHASGRHEYMMQLGSGTVDLLPGITYLGENRSLSWGAQAMGTVRLGTNDVGYSLGNRLRLNAWSSYRLTDWFAPSLRLEGQVWGNIHGQDPTLDPLVDPTFDPGKYGGRRVDLLLGANVFVPKGKWKGTRLSVEGGFPVYQNLDGPQLETDWTIGFSLSYSR